MAADTIVTFGYAEATSSANANASQAAFIGTSQVASTGFDELDSDSDFDTVQDLSVFGEVGFESSLSASGSANASAGSGFSSGSSSAFVTTNANGSGHAFLRAVSNGGGTSVPINVGGADRVISTGSGSGSASGTVDLTVQTIDANANPAGETPTLVVSYAARSSSFEFLDSQGSNPASPIGSVNGISLFPGAAGTISSQTSTVDLDFDIAAFSGGSGQTLTEPANNSSSRSINAEIAIVWGFDLIPGTAPTDPLQPVQFTPYSLAASASASASVSASGATPASDAASFLVPVSQNYGETNDVYLALAGIDEYSFEVQDNTFDSVDVPSALLEPGANSFQVMVDGTTYSGTPDTPFDLTTIDPAGVTEFTLVFDALESEEAAVAGVSFMTPGLAVVSQSGMAVSGGNFIVNTTDDTSDTNPGDGIAIDANGNTSLRAAIEEANALGNVFGNADVIAFDIPGAAPHVISLASSLPSITEAVLIDGTTEPDYVSPAGNSLGTPAVQVDGGNNLARGLRVFSGGADTTISGLSVTGFTNAGIELFGTSNATINANYVGLTPSGIAAGNFNGVKIVNGSNNDIDANVMSGNTRNGVFINSATAGANTLTNNYIGTSHDGTTSVPNALDGVNLRSGQNDIGLPGEGNLISGNGRWGIFGTTVGRGQNRVRGNTIGLDSTGLAAMGNVIGIYLQNESNEIGGSNTGDANVISGNSAFGVALSTTVSGTTTADFNTVSGNFIGTDASGTVDLGNGLFGVRITNGQANTIGGFGADDGNLISGNGSGILLAFASALNNVIVGNEIGTDETGLIPLANSGDGIRIVQGASFNLIDTNLISGNSGRGVSIDGPATAFNSLFSNLIGVTPDQTQTLHNGPGGAVRITAPDNSLTLNTISGPDFGILAFQSNASRTTIDSNYIGTDSLSLGSDLGNDVGVYLGGGVADTQIFYNQIANNNKGVVLKNASTGNLISENEMFSNATIGIDLGNDGPTSNDVNDTDEGENRLLNKPSSLVVTVDSMPTITTLSFDYTVDTPLTEATYPLTIEFFASNAAGDGLYVVDIAEVTAPGTYSFSGSYPTAGLPFLPTHGTATAIDDDGNTSEFADPVPIVITGFSSASLAPTSDFLSDQGTSSDVNEARDAAFAELTGPLF